MDATEPSDDAGEAEVRSPRVASDVELPALSRGSEVVEDSTKRVSFGLPEEATASRRRMLSMEGEFLSNEAGGVEDVRQMPYASAVICWIVVVALVGGSLIWCLERGDAMGATWVDCVYVALNGVTATGLATVDVTRLRPASHVLMVVYMQLGAATVLSLLPILARLRALRAALPYLRVRDGTENESETTAGAEPESPASPTSASLRRPQRRNWFTRRFGPDVTFDLRNYKKVPEWLVEYKALLFLQRVIVGYHVFCYVFYGGLLALYVHCSGAARAAATADVAASPLAWAAHAPPRPPPLGLLVVYVAMA